MLGAVNLPKGLNAVSVMLAQSARHLLQNERLHLYDIFDTSRETLNTLEVKITNANLQYISIEFITEEKNYLCSYFCFTPTTEPKSYMFTSASGQSIFQ